jgi:alkylation response protein AidB-like acyl-CoA dehydrogenase
MPAARRAERRRSARRTTAARPSLSSWRDRERLAAPASDHAQSGASRCAPRCAPAKDWPVERFLRDAKLLDIGAGTNEIRRMLIGRELIGGA